jgi:hypothetical protein
MGAEDEDMTKSKVVKKFQRGFWNFPEDFKGRIGIGLGKLLPFTFDPDQLGDYELVKRYFQKPRSGAKKIPDPETAKLIALVKEAVANEKKTKKKKRLHRDM